MTSIQKNEIRQALQILRYSHSLHLEAERIRYAKIADERILKVVESDDEKWERAGCSQSSVMDSEPADLPEHNWC